MVSQAPLTVVRLEMCAMYYSAPYSPWHSHLRTRHMKVFLQRKITGKCDFFWTTTLLVDNYTEWQWLYTVYILLCSREQYVEMHKKWKCHPYSKRWGQFQHIHSCFPSVSTGRLRRYCIELKEELCLLKRLYVQPWRPLTTALHPQNASSTPLRSENPQKSPAAPPMLQTMSTRVIVAVFTIRRESFWDTNTFTYDWAKRGGKTRDHLRTNCNFFPGKWYTCTTWLRSSSPSKLRDLKAPAKSSSPSSSPRIAS